MIKRRKIKLIRSFVLGVYLLVFLLVLFNTPKLFINPAIFATVSLGLIAASIALFHNSISDIYKGKQNKLIRSEWDTCLPEIEKEVSVVRQSLSNNDSYELRKEARYRISKLFSNIDAFEDRINSKSFAFTCICIFLISLALFIVQSLVGAPFNLWKFEFSFGALGLISLVIGGMYFLFLLNSVYDVEMQ